MALSLSPSSLVHHSTLPVWFTERKQTDSVRRLPFFQCPPFISFEKKKKKKNNDTLERKLLLGILLPFIII
jgi:hypothetical protein